MKYELVIFDLDGTLLDTLDDLTHAVNHALRLQGFPLRQSAEVRRMIGNGIATAVARLKESDAKSRVVILLTDGVNNTGEISPQMATEIAKTYGVRVYTIGIGAMGEAPYPTDYGIQMVKVDIDEPLMKQIAADTGGKYFRATDNTKLAEIYAEINKMEKTRTIVDTYPQYKELFMRFALIALLAVILEVIMRLFTRHLPD